MADWSVSIVLFLISFVSLIILTLVLEVDSASGSTSDTTTAGTSRPCKKKDYHYTYTECGDNGERWRVAVPTKACTGGVANPEPIKAPDCGITCDKGYFLDIINDQTCKKCPKGTYSLGGGVSFEDWTTMPKGFSVTADVEGWLTREGDNCTVSFWKARGNYIKSPGDFCNSKLIYSANLKKDGYLNFTYSLANSDTMFHVEIRNDECEAVAMNNFEIKFPDPTGENKWDNIFIPLDAGLNIITWKAFGVREWTSGQPPSVYIRNIEIMGLDYTSSCTDCPPGTYSPEDGSSYCIPCEADTIATGKAFECTQCAESKYAPPGSSKCITKKLCTEKDYYKFYDYSNCDTTHKTNAQYNWIKPVICFYGKAGAANLPADGPDEDCPKCNPGMEIDENGKCQFCPDGKFSDLGDKCKPCPSRTAPVKMMQFKNWLQLPPNMETECLSDDMYKCVNDDGWVPSGNHIHSGENFADDVYLVMDLQVDGFKAEESYFEGKAEIVGTITFTFELDCLANCALYFVQSQDFADSEVVHSWVGKTPIKTFKYDLTTIHQRTFTWAFEKTDSDSVSSDNITEDRDLRHDKVIIYNITVTNTENGGAVLCKECPLGAQKQECVPCKDGEYFNNKTNQCIPCKANTYLRADRRSCAPCGPGLKNSNGDACYSDCKFTIGKREYDVSELMGFHSIRSGASFTERGNKYYKIYNISLCGTEGKKETECATSFDYSSRRRPNQPDDDADSFNGIKSLICRLTILPDPESPTATYSTQATSLGDILVGITDKDSLHGLVGNITRSRTDSKAVGNLPDVKFFFHSPYTTSACPDGRTTVITMRCVLSEKGNGTITFPPACPEGTCDGCNFHLLWETEMACPKCTNKDFESIKGECKDSKQKLHYQWITPVVCRGGVALPKVGMSECEMPKWYETMPWYIQWFIAGLVTIGFLMTVMILYFWKRNRKLEYKYQKLVESKNGELPAAETCALSEGEEDDDVIFQDGNRKSKGFFNKFKSSRQDQSLLAMADDLTLQ